MKKPIADVKFRADLYPRLKHSQEKAQEYAEHIEQLPPIEVNQHSELIDGYHRLVAHKLCNLEEIEVTVTETSSDNHLLSLAIQRNAKHGFQLSQEDKRKMAIRFYAMKEYDKPGLVALLSVSMRTVQQWVSNLDTEEREERRRKILEMHLRCYTAEEIGEAVGLEERQARNETEALSAIYADLRKFPKVTFSEPEFVAPVYNVWAFGKLSNETTHYGNTEQRIVDNLLWLYTQPLEIVVDPFAGGGSTLDVCEKRLRRCWVSDRKPKPGLEGKIRTLDVCDALPQLNKRWSEVALVYLDPPYWRQAAGEYSEDPEDLANMPLEQFTAKLAAVVKAFASKLRQGTAVALIIQPTQWRSEPKGAFTDHVFDVVSAVGNRQLTVENRIQCPYQTQQCTPQMVEWAKVEKKPLVLSRELVIWRKS